jgi:hypothetical protein
MQLNAHSSLFRVSGWAVILIGIGVVSALVLGAASIRRARKLHLASEWTGGGQTGNVFQGPAEWADINETATE